MAKSFLKFKVETIKTKLRFSLKKGNRKTVLFDLGTELFQTNLFLYEGTVVPWVATQGVNVVLIN